MTESCYIVKNTAMGKEFLYCRVHKVESLNEHFCPKKYGEENGKTSNEEEGFDGYDEPMDHAELVDSLYCIPKDPPSNNELQNRLQSQLLIEGVKLDSKMIVDTLKQQYGVAQIFIDNVSEKPSEILSPMAFCFKEMEKMGKPFEEDTQLMSGDIGIILPPKLRTAYLSEWPELREYYINTKMLFPLPNVEGPIEGESYTTYYREMLRNCPFLGTDKEDECSACKGVRALGLTNE